MDNAPILIGNYRLSKTLGIGAFGKVKLGEHIPTKYKVAVKILNKAKIAALDMGEKVRREINILRICKHPHIIRLYEVIDTPTDIFVVMEYAPGGELFDYIVGKGKPAPEDARRLFRQLISAVEYCHYHNIVHRDLKPENLLLDKDNNLKIADFGLSNLMRDGEFLKTSCGSPNYAAPEVIMGNLYAGPEVDVWSCGVILYALLCGSLPFDDENIPNLFKKIKSGMYSLPSHLLSLPRDLIPRMLIVDPMKRITIPEIRSHAWFMEAVPDYLTLSPKQFEEQASQLDEEVVEAMLKLPLGPAGAGGITKAKIAQAVLPQKDGKTSGCRGGRRVSIQLKVTYELLLGNKHTKERLMDCVAASRRLRSTPPAFTPKRLDSPRQSRNSSGVSGVEQLTSDAARILSRHSQNPAATSTPRSMLTPRGASALEEGSSFRSGIVSSSSAMPRSSFKKRKWFLGIQSKKAPSHVMTEVYRALLHLSCEWRMLNSYGLLCRWYPPYDSTSSCRRDGERFKVIMGLTLYKVQDCIYLLDFQRKEGDQFSFMTLCAMVIHQLKIFSATNRMSQTMNSEPLAVSQMTSSDIHGHLSPSHAVPFMPIPPYRRPSQQQQSGDTPYRATPYPGSHVRRQEI